MKGITRNLIVILLSVLSINTYANNNQDSLKTQCHNLIEEGKIVVRKDLAAGLQLFSEAIEILNIINKEKLNQEEKISLSRCLYNRAYYYNKNSFYLKRSINDARKRIDIIGDSPSRQLGGTHDLLARIYENSGEYELTEIHYKKAINVFEQLGDFKNKHRMNNNLAISYYNQKKYNKALETLDIYYSYLTDSLNIRDYSVTYGSIYDESGKLDLAYNYHQKALDYSTYSIDIARSKNNLGITLTKLKRYEEAIIELDGYYNLLREIYDSKYYTKYAIYFNNKGDVFRDQGNLDSALVYHNLAITHCLNDSLNIQDVFKNPSKDQLLLCEIKPLLLKCLKSKANTAYLFYQKNNQKKYLELSQNCYTVHDQLFKIMWQEYAGNESKLFWISDSRKDYLKSISGAIENNKIETALNFANDNKAVLLSGQLKKLDLEKSGKIPKTLFEKEKGLYLKIKSTNNDQEKLEFYDELQYTRDKMKEIDSKHFSLMYETPQFDKREIQDSISQETAILKYIYSKEKIYAFLITKDTLLATPITIGNSFEDSLVQFKKILIDPIGENGLNNDYGSVLINIGYELYKKLLEPFEKYLKEDLIIIPDGVLTGIPFQAFPTKGDTIKSHDYQSVPFLLQKYNLSYANSLDVLLEQMKMEVKTNKNYLGVAPIYFKEFVLSELTHTLKEVENGRELFDGDLLLGEDAKVQSLKNDTNAYKILHYATHATQFDSITKNPTIYLDTRYDLNQIYASNTKAELVIISACEAGMGNSIKGEGVMSLSRGFAYNGVPSLLSTINVVDEESSTYLVEQYFKYIKAGEKKNVALRKAQLEMINNNPFEYSAMPYKWANYIQIGDTKPMFEKKTNYLAYFGAAFCSLITLGLILGFAKKT